MKTKFDNIQNLVIDSSMLNDVADSPSAGHGHEHFTASGSRQSIHVRGSGTPIPAPQVDGGSTKIKSHAKS